jgi:hypothetical protein
MGGMVGGVDGGGWCCLFTRNSRRSVSEINRGGGGSSSEQQGVGEWKGTVNGSVRESVLSNSKKRATKGLIEGDGEVGAESFLFCMRRPRDQNILDEIDERSKYFDEGEREIKIF